jgi:hypothetical protein
MAFLLGLGPGFCAAFILRPRDMSASVQSQSVRRPPMGIGLLARINPRASQRLSVLNDTPIFRAACLVLYVFFIFFSLTKFSSSNTLIASASHRHQFDF